MMSTWTPRPWLDSHDRHATDDLMRSLSGGNYDQLLVDVTRLLDKGAHPDGSHQNGMPLRLAVNMRSPALVADLLAHGADPNARFIDPEVPNDQGKKPWNNCETALQYAVYRGCFFDAHHKSTEHIKCILQLIAAGADTQACSRFGMSCLDLAKIESKGSAMVPRTLELPIHAAIAIKDPKLCLDLLEAGHDAELKNARRQTAWRNAELNSPECHAAMSAWRAAAVMRSIKRATTQVEP